MPPAPAPKKYRKWPWILAVVALFIIIIGSTTKPAVSSTSTTPTVVNAGPVASRAQTAAAAPAPAAPAPATATTFGPGTYEVGKGDGQIPPGKYKSTGPDGSNFAGCYYARLRTNDGSLGDILANNVSQGPSIFTAKPTDGYIEITGCSFTKV